VLFLFSAGLVAQGPEAEAPPDQWGILVPRFDTGGNVFDEVDHKPLKPFPYTRGYILLPGHHTISFGYITSERLNEGRAARIISHSALFRVEFDAIRGHQYHVDIVSSQAVVADDSAKEPWFLAAASSQVPPAEKEARARVHISLSGISLMDVTMGPYVYCDNVALARLMGRGCYCTVRLPPCKHELRAGFFINKEPPSELRGDKHAYGTDFAESFEVNTPANQDLYLRVKGHGLLHPKLTFELTDKAQFEADMAKFKMVQMWSGRINPAYQ
jgi:hypothetical protein